MSDTTNTLTLAPEIQELQILGAFANQLCKSEALPACYKNAANVLVALQTGKEMGLKPMQSLNSLYIVNGKITIWGSAQVQLLKEHGWSIKINEHTDKVCSITIHKGNEQFDYSTKFDELPAKSNAKTFAPKEKLYYHTISRLIRFYCPEVLGGNANLYNEVEVDSIPDNEIEATVTPTTKSTLQKFIEEEVETVEALEAIKDKLKTQDELEAYANKLESFQPQEEGEDVKDALFTDTKPKTL
jgi:hypothetical protein